MFKSRLLPVLVLSACLPGSGSFAQEDFSPRTSTGGTADFSGVGLGVDAGVGLGSANNLSTSFNSSGLIGGAHVGYNFQAQRLVGGVEADFLTSRISSGTVATMSFKQNFLSSARVKGGYVFGDLLAYGTIGYAYSTASYRDFSGSSDKTIKGAAFGGGLEYAVTRNFSIRGEYIRYNFGTQTYVTPVSALPISTNTNLVRAGASVHF
jgi:outer membrane immunogenic protein